LTAKTGTNSKTVQLPLDVIIMVNGKKIIAESKILDGVAVFERILRDPYKVDFEFTVRQLSTNANVDATLSGGTTTPLGNALNQNGNIVIGNFLNKSGVKNYVFPQDILADYIKNIWEPNSIIEVENSYLNKVYGIFELVVEDLAEVATIRGSNNVPMKLSCKENYDSQDFYADSLIVV
jgi:hypothetical protein